MDTNYRAFVVKGYDEEAVSKMIYLDVESPHDTFFNNQNGQLFINGEGKLVEITVSEGGAYFDVFSSLDSNDYIRASVMEYTGKKDSYNKKIYEGDILKCTSHGIDKDETRVVCWDSFQARFKSVPLSTYHSNAGNGGWTGYDLHRTNCEVLGNVYENQDLIY